MATPISVEGLVKAEPKEQKQLARMTGYAPNNLTEAIQFAKLIANSDLAPKDFKGKPANVLIAMQMGAEVGLAPMQAIQNIAVINGRPCLWGDSALAVVQVHPAYEWHKEWMEGEAHTRGAVFQIKRRGQDMHQVRFGYADAAKAGLLTKDGTWKTYPDRMMQMRARGFGLRDKFADALRGMILAEEAMDIPPDNGGPKPRETGILDATSELGTLQPSAEPNRGHGNEAMQQTTKCDECHALGGHLPKCSKRGQNGQKAHVDPLQASEIPAEPLTPEQKKAVEARRQELANQQREIVEKRNGSHPVTPTSSGPESDLNSPILRFGGSVEDEIRLRSGE